MLVGDSIIANAIMEDYNVLARREEETIRLKTIQEGVEQLVKEKVVFEKLKQTEKWVASAGLEQVRSLAKLPSDERKLWKEACARENEKFFRVRQELNNLKAANVALVKEKTAAEAAIKEAETRGATALKEAKARAAKELADANADCTKLNKVVEELQAELKSRVSILEEVTSRATKAETRARQAEETRDGLTTSLAHVTDDHAWMRQHGIGHVSTLCLFNLVFALLTLLLSCDQIVETILDAPENAAAVTNMNERARWARFKAEAAFDAAVDAYNKLSIPVLDRIETCSEAKDYVDRLRMLFNPVKEGEGTSGVNVE
ncbi:hypothetical protein Hanom_Chr00s001127g01674391 [Helianthus anomalus]